MKHYSIHNILKISTNVDFFPQSLVVDKIRSPDLEIAEKNLEFEKRKPPTYQRFPIKSYGSGKKIVVEYAPKKLLLKLILENLEGKTKLNFEESGIYKPFHNVIFPGWPSMNNIITFLLQIKLLQKGYVAIHSATISKKDVGILLPAWPSTGKSTACRNLSEMGFEVLGDEIGMFSTDRRAYKIFESGAFGLGGGTPQFRKKTPFPFETEKESVKIDKVLFLKKGSPKVGKVELDNMINMILASTNIAFQNTFTRHIFLSYCLTSGFDPNFIEKDSRKILKKVLKKVSCYVVYGDRTNFHKTIDDLVGD